MIRLCILGDNKNREPFEIERAEAKFSRGTALGEGECRVLACAWIFNQIIHSSGLGFSTRILSFFAIYTLLIIVPHPSLARWHTPILAVFLSPQSDVRSDKSSHFS